MAGSSVYKVDLATCPAFGPAPAVNDTLVGKMATDYFTGGIIMSRLSEFYDKDEKTWKNLNGYYDLITGKTQGTTATTTGALLKTVASDQNENDISIPNISQRSKDDEDLSNLIEKEYCHYSSRYNSFLTAFLGEIANATPDTTKASQLLQILKDLNMKLNALASFVDYYSNVRIAHINARASALNKVNATIKANIDKVATPVNDLVSSQNVLNTRKEMIRYTKEKNNSIANQISLWAALNIVAIGMIFHLYRTM